jgi:hypothetical protein
MPVLGSSADHLCAPDWWRSERDEKLLFNVRASPEGRAGDPTVWPNAPSLDRFSAMRCPAPGASRRAVSQIKGISECRPHIFGGSAPAHRIKTLTKVPRRPSWDGSGARVNPRRLNPVRSAYGAIVVDIGLDLFLTDIQMRNLRCSDDGRRHRVVVRVQPRVVCR